MSTITIEKPDTADRLIRFAAVRGLTLTEALEELLDEAEEVDELPLDTIPDILMKAAPDDLRKAQEEMDSGKWVSGDDFLAELRRPLAD